MGIEWNVITDDDVDEKRAPRARGRAARDEEADDPGGAGGPGEAGAGGDGDGGDGGDGDGGGKATTSDDAYSKLLKYIPAISVGTYLAIEGVVAKASNQSAEEVLLWITFAVILIGTPIFYARRGVVRPSQLAITAVVFAVWVFAIGGPFAASWGGYDSLYGSVALFLGAFALTVWNPTPLPNTD